jgi:hypothetical protein
MSFLQMARLSAGVAAVALMLGATASETRAADAGFGSSFTCLQLTNGLSGSSSGKAPSDLARVWIHGYLTGYYKTQGKLEMTDDPDGYQDFSDSLVRTCKDFPQASILGISVQYLVKRDRKMPGAAGSGFTPSSYTCGQHTDAKAGSAGDLNKADLAELWAFALVQGNKNVGTPDMEIPSEYMQPVIGALNNACVKNRDTLYMDLAAQVADKVKIAP